MERFVIRPAFVMIVILVLLLNSGCNIRPTVIDLDGQAIDIIASKGQTALVVVFVRTDCPIANRYVPEIMHLVSEYEPQGIAFALVYASQIEDFADIRKHMSDYSLDLDVYRDPTHEFARFVGATITPEAVVFANDNRMVYRGRIDNRFVDFGKTRPEPTRRDLSDVLSQLAAGERIEFGSTNAVGCYIESNTPAE